MVCTYCRRKEAEPDDTICSVCIEDLTMMDLIGYSGMPSSLNLDFNKKDF